MNGTDLLNKRVSTRGVELGIVDNVILDDETGAPIGVEVRCGDGVHRFLPLGAARVGEEALEIDSPLLLLESQELDFYRRRSRPLRSRR
jgi:hypothetical protein